MKQMKIGFWLALSLFVSGTSWIYTQRILAPWEYHVNVESGRVIASMGDLYPRWVGTRELLLHGRNPYSSEVSHEIQMAFYGHIIAQSYGETGKTIIDEQRFAYPVYVVFLLAPTAYATFADVQAWAPAALALLSIATVLLWLDFLRWRPSRMTITAIILFVLASPQIIQGLRLRQLGLVVGFLLALGVWCVARNRLVSAGIVFALSTIKPQMAILPLAWFLLWTSGEWRKRWPLLASFGGTLALLVVAGELILPGWLTYFVKGLIVYPKYVPITSLLQLTLGDKVGEVFGGVAIVALLALGWRNRRHVADSPEFAITLAAFCIGMTLALPLLPPFNQVMLLLPIFIIVRDWVDLGRLSRFAFLLCISWPCLASLVLMLLFPPQLKSASHLPLLPSILSPVLPFLVPLVLVAGRQRRAAVIRPA
jgi:hypothetical protein